MTTVHPRLSEQAKLNVWQGHNRIIEFFGYLRPGISSTNLVMNFILITQNSHEGSEGENIFEFHRFLESSTG